MTLSGEQLADQLGGIRFPVAVMHQLVDAPAIDRADRGTVEDLAIRGAVTGRWEGDQFVELRLTMPMDTLRYKLRHRRLPVAECQRTVIRHRSKAGTIYFEPNFRGLENWA